MMEDWQQRTRLLIGDQAINRLAHLHIMVAGVGGVGGYVVEALARAGVGRLTLIDHDVVSVSNRNRQLVALTSTLDQAKVEVMRARIALIHPECQVAAYQQSICQDSPDWLVKQQPDMVIDAIDSMSCKVSLLAACVRANIPVYSSMGAGRRLDVSAVQVMDVMDTQICGLARAVRQGLRKQGIGRGIRCVVSTELPRQPAISAADNERQPNGTISYMPAIFGITLAGEALASLLRSQPAADNGEHISG